MDHGAKKMKPQNIYSHLPSALEQELVEKIACSAGVKIERIVSFGQATPEGEWLQQESNEWVILLSGLAGIRFDGGAKALPLKPGDYLNIPGGTRHRVEWTNSHQPSVWLAVHY